VGSPGKRPGRCAADSAAPAGGYVRGGAIRGADGWTGAGGSPHGGGDTTGNGRYPGAGRPGIENYARLAAQCAADLRCDVVVGFSMGANVALEMAGSGAFRGPLVRLAPSFSRQDVAVFFRLLDRLAPVLGHLPIAALLKMMGPAMYRMPLPPDRREVLAAEFRKNDPRVVRRINHRYFQYLDRHGSVASRLCATHVPAWVVHGERGDGGVTDEERHTLEACPQIRLGHHPGPELLHPQRGACAGRQARGGGTRPSPQCPGRTAQRAP
jgi:hypothetical protein